jgi:orotate phosphoribosyltransferase-like protein
MTRPHATPADLKRMLQLADEGMVSSWIAEDLGLPARTVREHLGRTRGYSITKAARSDWYHAWQTIRRSTALFELHKEFAPKGV